MNFKTNILKLSIMLMLILVLIPVVVAEDTSESFYIEYVDDSSEAIVEESISTNGIGYSQQDTSYASTYYEVNSGSEISDIEYSGGFAPTTPINQSNIVEDNCDAVLILEQEDCPVLETHDVLEDTENDCVSILHEKIISDINYSDIYENCDDELTVENTSVIKQGSLFNLKHNNMHFTFTGLYNVVNNYETSSFKRSSIKVLELKNDLLIKQDISHVFSEDVLSGLDCDAIVCINKVTTDFIFSIDNSVIGDENLIFFIGSFSCFNLIPCFDAFISCGFLDVDCFFVVVVLIAAEVLCKLCFVEVFVENIMKFNLNQGLI